MKQLHPESKPPTLLACRYYMKTHRSRVIKSQTLIQRGTLSHFVYLIRAGAEIRFYWIRRAELFIIQKFSRVHWWGSSRSQGLRCSLQTDRPNGGENEHTEGWRSAAAMCFTHQKHICRAVFATSSSLLIILRAISSPLALINVRSFFAEENRTKTKYFSLQNGFLSNDTHSRVIPVQCN